MIFCNIWTWFLWMLSFLIDEIFSSIWYKTPYLLNDVYNYKMYMMSDIKGCRSDNILGTLILLLFRYLHLVIHLFIKFRSLFLRPQSPGGFWDIIRQINRFTQVMALPPSYIGTALKKDGLHNIESRPQTIVWYYHFFSYTSLG